MPPSSWREKRGSYKAVRRMEYNEMAAKGRKKLKSYAFIRLLRLLAAILLPRSVARPVIVPFGCRNGAVGCPRSGLRCPEFARFTDISAGRDHADSFGKPGFWRGVGAAAGGRGCKGAGPPAAFKGGCYPRPAGWLSGGILTSSDKKERRLLPRLPGKRKTKFILQIPK